MATTIPEVIGLPPADNSFKHDKNMIADTMPIAKIYPCMPDFTAGLAMFRLKKAPKYFSLLSQHGYSLGSNHLKVAFLADSFPTDNFQNNYSESFFQNIATGISQGASTIMQTMGSRTGTEGFVDLMKAGGTVMDEMGFGAGKGAFDMAAKMATKTKQAIDAHKNDKGALGSVVSALDTVLGGSRFDFPMIWTDSSFQPSYTMTIRLYNPDPGDEEATSKYIIGPLAALLLLGLPISTDKKGSTYNYPFLHKIICPGIYFLNPCFISNISVIKGGDQQQIAYNQNLGIVDVRIDFGSLFSSMLASEHNNNDRPTLKTYLSAMQTSKDLEEELTEKHFLSVNDSVLWSDPFSPITTKTIKDLPSRVSPEINLTEYNITDTMIGDLGSLQKAVDKGLNVTESTATELYKNGVISVEDLKSVFPNIEVPELKLPVQEYLQNISKSSMSLFSGLGSSASALMTNVADLDEMSSMISDAIKFTPGNILPDIYFDGDLIAKGLTKSQAGLLLKSIADKKNSIIETATSALSRMTGEVKYLNNLSSNFNNISGLTGFLSKSLNFSSYDDLMDNILHPGNIIDNAKDIVTDMVKSGLKFNANNMFKGIVSTIQDEVEQVDLLKNIINKGIDFAGRLDIIDMIKNGVHFDVKNVLLDIAGEDINFQANGLLKMITGKNYNFNATEVLRQVMNPGQSFKNMLNVSDRLHGMLDELKDSALGAGANIARDLSKDMLGYVKATLKNSKNTMKIDPNKYINKASEAATNELNKGNIMIRDFLKQQVHTIAI